MDDSISRHVAIDAFINTNMFRREVKIGIINILEELPTVDMITCDRCKHGVHSGRGDIYMCVVSPEERSEHKYDFWCAYADKKDDETTK